MGTDVPRVVDMIEWVLIVYTIFGPGGDPALWVVRQELHAFEERVHCESALAAHRIAGELVSECQERKLKEFIVP